MSDMTHAHAAAHAHPTPATYAKIAAILCIITFIEFGAFYTPPLRAVLVPLLLVLSAIKFSLVVMFYMHLKFDHNVFTRLLIGGLFIGAGVLISLAVLFQFSHPINIH